MMRVDWNPSLAIFTTIAVLALPAIAVAQDTIEHESVYSGTDLETLLGGRAIGSMPKIPGSMLPRAALMQHNALPSGSEAPVPGASEASADGTNIIPPPIAPAAYGDYSKQAIAPYTIARASATLLGPTPTAAAVAVTSYPWRATGKLYFSFNSQQFVCSASMIKPGLLLTAAHCVFEYGLKKGGWHYDYAWVPAQYGDVHTTVPPYGIWKTLTERIPRVYHDGTDTCIQVGVVCNNDIAIITMQPDAKAILPGKRVGWYSYNWNGYSFVTSFGAASLASITQLGYPVALDEGMMMERTDGIGSYWTQGLLKNTLLGTPQTGGSSGGPWLVNFGASPIVDAQEASLGNEAYPQIVVGVSSWVESDLGSNTGGSSWFGQNAQFPAPKYIDSHGFTRGAGNIGKLVADSCSAHFDHC